MAASYSSHPIFMWRKAIIAIGVIGIVLSIFATLRPTGQAFIASVVLLALSIILCVADLSFFVRRNRITLDDTTPKWPKWKWLFFDTLLAVIFQIAFWELLDALTWTYDYGTNMLGAYAALSDLLCSILHACCIWKQLIAFHENRWLAKYRSETCPRCECRFIDDIGDQARSAQPIDEQSLNTLMYDDLPEEEHHAPVGRRRSTESNMEDGLLIESDLGATEDEAQPEQSTPAIAGKGKQKATRPGSTSGDASGSGSSWKWKATGRRS